MRMMKRVLSVFVLLFFSMQMINANAIDRVGSFSDHVYKNDFLGFQITLPDDWHFKALRLRQSSDKRLALFRFYKVTGSQEKVIFIDGVAVSHDAFTSSVNNLKQYLALMKLAIQKRGAAFDIKFSDNLPSVEFGGTQFAQMDLSYKVKGHMLYQSIYAAKVKNYFVALIVTTNIPGLHQEAKNILSSIKFTH